MAKVALTFGTLVVPAHADEPEPETETASGAAAPPLFGVTARPPPLRVRYMQYGPALTAELIGFLSSPGPTCNDATRSDGQPERTCILGSGGGIAFRAGLRPSGVWYFGGAYEISRQDSNKLMRLPIMQQLRAEGRYYLRPDLQTQPYGTFGLGAAAYGNEGAFTDTLGPLGFVGIGTETQLSTRYVFIFGLSYRALLFNRFTDSSGAHRPAGLATALALEVGLESRDPL